MVTFNPAENNINLICRLVSSDGRIEMGIYPVLYGFRVRAGFVNCPCCSLDWCAGESDVSLRNLYTICKNILEPRLEQVDPFQDVPPWSHVKPWFKDRAFTEKIVSMVKDFKMESIPSGSELRDEYFNAWFEFNFVPTTAWPDPKGHDIIADLNAVNKAFENDA